MEIWKDIKNYEGLYQVSSKGRVKNIKFLTKPRAVYKERILKQNLKKTGYLTVDLSKNNFTKTISVHRLVAIAFLGEPKDERKEVNHINCNKQDNRLENLEWVTRQENQQHAIENNRVGFPPNRKKVRCTQLNKTFESSYAAAEYLVKHIFKGTKTVSNVACRIRACVNGYQTIAYGFNWERI